MNLRISYLLLLLFAISATGFAQGYPMIPSSAPYSGKKLSCHETSDNFWVYGTGSKGRGFYTNFNGWKYVKIQDNVEVASFCGGYNGMTVLTTDNKILRWVNNNFWADTKGITNIKDLIDKPHGLFVIGTVGSQTGVFKYARSSQSSVSWEPIFVGPSATSLTKIDVDNSGTLYALNTSGQLLSWKTGYPRFTLVSTQNPPVMRDFVITRKSEVWGSDANNKIWGLHNPSNTWSMTGFSASPSWGVTDQGNIYGVVSGGAVKGIVGGSRKTFTIQDPNQLDVNGNTPLTTAVRTGKTGDISTLIANGADINKPDKVGNTPLIYAAQQGSSISTLIRNKADVNLADKNGYTPLYWTIKNKRGSSNARALVTAGAKTDSKGVNEALAETDFNYFSSYATILRDGKADLKPVLPLVAAKSDVAKLNKLIELGYRPTEVAAFQKATDVNNREVATICLDNGTNKDEALKYSLEKSNGDMIGLCLEKGANAEPAVDFVIAKNDVMLANKLVDNYGVSSSTMLSKSVGSNNTQIARVALERHADPNPHIDGVVKGKNREMYSLLLNHNANPTTALRSSVLENNTDFARMAANKGGSGSDPTLIRKAVDNKNREMTQLLIGAGANVRDPGLVRSTVSDGDMDMTRLLVTNGAPVNDPSLVMIPVKSKNYDMANLLLSSGASASDPQLIRTSVNNEDLRMTELLIQKGASTSDVNLLVTAIDKDNYELTNLLVVNGAPASDPAGIKKSVQKNNVKITSLLLTNGASAAAPGLITQSVENNSTKMTSLLIQNGASATPPALIKRAVGHNNTGLCKLLFDNGATVTDPALISTSVKNNNLELSTMLLDKGASAEPADLIQGAVGHKNIGLVRVLVDRGANPSNGIKSAVSTNQTDISLYLLDKGAAATDPSLMQNSAQFGNLSIVKKLVEKGANPEDGTKNAVGHGKDNVLGFLVTQGVNVKKTEYMGTAVASNHVGVYRILMTNEAPLDYVDTKGNNLIHLACANQSAEMMKGLADKKVDVNRKNNDGDTPLIIVVTDEKNQTDLAKILVDAGADVNATNAKGKTVLRVCKGREVKKYLKSVGASRK